MTETSKTTDPRSTGDQRGPGTLHTVVVPTSINMVALLGPRDAHLGLIEKALAADIHVRGNEITLTGEPGEVALAERMLDELVTILRTGQGLSPETVERVITMLRAETTERPADVLSLNILSNRGRTIRPEDAEPEALRRRDRQAHHRLRHRPGRHREDLSGDGQGGPGAPGQEGQPDHPSRPAVEAGERLGFLPGTLSEKIDPYLRPLYDALHDMVDPESIPKLLAAGTIEVAPLAFLRGRSLNDSFIILDEAQNTTAEQMKMFLTRLGFGSKIVVTGDVTQVDLPSRRALRPADRRGHPRRASRTSPSTGSPPTTWSATSSSARSWRPTTSSTLAPSTCAR